MSAIAGLVFFDQKPIRDEVGKMGSVLSIYGKDSCSDIIKQNVGLYAALSRITHEDQFDTQPLESTSIILVADCRIDNRSELRDLLSIDPNEAKTMSDSQFILAAYHKWKENCVHHLSGDFAFAVWDLKQRHFFIARDPMGYKPLFWCCRNNGFAFASMPKGLHALHFVPKEINKERLIEDSALLPYSGTSSFFYHIHRIEPGHYLKISSGRKEYRRFFEFDADTKLKLKNDLEYLDAFSDIFERATANCLRTTGKAASHLSSGFDSTTVTAVAARIQKKRNRRLSAFTSVPLKGFKGPVPKGRHADESLLAGLLVRRFTNIDHFLVHSDFDKDFKRIERVTYLADQIFRNFFNLGWMIGIIEEASLSGHKVLLNAQSGNANISYTGLEALPELMKNGRLLDLAREIYYLKKKKTLGLKSSVYRTLAPFIPEPFSNILLKRRINFEFIHDLKPCHFSFVNTRAKEIGFSLRYGPYRDTVSIRLQLLMHADQGYFAKVHEAFGLEMRSPCQDLKVNQFLLALPWNQFLRNGESRYFIRQYMRDTLPAEILRPNSKGLQAADWFHSLIKNQEQIHKKMDIFSVHPLFTQLFDFDKIKGYLSKIPTNGWGTPDTIHRYRKSLGKNLSHGTFIQMHSQDNCR